MKNKILANYDSTLEKFYSNAVETDKGEGLFFITIAAVVLFCYLISELIIRIFVSIKSCFKECE